MTARNHLTEPEIEARIAEIEDARVPTRSDEAMLIRADEHRYERHVYGDDRDRDHDQPDPPARIHMTRRQARDWEREKRLRKIREFERWAAS